MTDSMFVECQSRNKMIQFQNTTSWVHLSDFIIKTHTFKFQKQIIVHVVHNF